jgi:hypothetical protein
MWEGMMAMSRTSDTLVSPEQLEEALRWYIGEGWSNWGYSDADWLLACRQMLDELERLARTSGDVIFYKQLAERTLLSNSAVWHHVLSAMLLVQAKACRIAGLPMVTALVYGKSTGVPGPGFREAAKQLGYQKPGEDELTFWIGEIDRVRGRWQ